MPTGHHSVLSLQASIATRAKPVCPGSTICGNEMDTLRSTTDVDMPITALHSPSSDSSMGRVAFDAEGAAVEPGAAHGLLSDTVTPSA